MKMNLFFLMIVFFFSNINAIAQTKQVKEALIKGKNSELLYTAKVGKNSLITPTHLEKWYKKHENKYYLVDFETRKVWFAGTERVLISSFSFIEQNDMQAYNDNQADMLRQKALAAQRKAELSALDVFAIGALAYIFSSTATRISNYADNVKDGVYAREAQAARKAQAQRDQYSQTPCYKLIREETIEPYSGHKFTSYVIDCTSRSDSYITFFRLPYRVRVWGGYDEPGWYKYDGLIFKTPSLITRDNISFDKLANEMCGCY